MTIPLTSQDAAPASFIPPPPGEIEPCLAAWEKFLYASELPPLVTIALAHYQFEAVHPFLDGNGRVGRLLIALFLIEQKILPAPLLYLSLGDHLKIGHLWVLRHIW